MLEALFEPYEMQGLKLSNRWVMAPMTRKQSPNNTPTGTVAEYYRRRAAGGVGLIITEGVLIEHPLASPDDDIPAINADTVAAWQQVVAAAHEGGAHVFPQLWHQGPIARPGISATAVIEDDVEVVPKADAAQEQLMFDAFVRGAVNSKLAGFDGIELHGAHGYLLDSFLRAGRIEYVCDLVREIRQQVGPDYPIIIRFSQWTVRDLEAQLYHTPQELERALCLLQDAGVNIFHASTRRFWLPEFPGESDLNLAGWTRKLTGAPTITVGNVGLVTEQFCGSGPESMKELMRRYDQGEFDMVAVGRPLISDAEWCHKVRDDRTDEIVDHSAAANDIYP
ncbi:MAG TPA: 12-oxophytodienoate reductase [Candidatus Latescibacteria bacterium]|jgi:2,4-dienoyl-CoA reductase-like NADH-dependent reductase (Old Yellow Enzyme family)|nr:12-oxophytodienoate reductase [Gemmatimonadaceae bacterium]MDP6017649.1 12-oxophytodienoate reductase [Candidatus Latescibacterota bacterium]HJP31692.1 12-oxophytodienoate reductase [Candidatus Latescibacterota bacterium]|tara:strand:+ start:11 stop:1021 length:1011 start_codon:yes stop_codon:yes gene_type:complete